MSHTDTRRLTLGDSEVQFFVNRKRTSAGRDKGVKNQYLMTRMDRETGDKVVVRITAEQYEKLRQKLLLQAELIFNARVFQ